MSYFSEANIPTRIEEFKKRSNVEREFCYELFEYATIRLMCHKYAYYIHSCNFVEDMAYDFEEKGWYCMGRALGELTEEETSPCIDWDENHYYAAAGIALARSLRPIGWRRTLGEEIDKPKEMKKATKKKLTKNKKTDNV